MSRSTASRLAGVALAVALAIPSAPSGTLYVHPSRGTDTAVGSSDAPLRTLETALQQARQAARPASIVLAEGRHELAAPLDLGPDDTGLTLMAAPGAAPVVSGGQRLLGWKPDPDRPGLWTTILQDVQQGRWYFHQLFVNGERAPRARTPNEGFLRARGPLGTNSPIALPFHPGDLRSEWAQFPDARLVMLMKWTDLHVPIRSIDAGTHVAHLAGGPRPYWMNENDARYWVENVPDALDAPGEWYLDRATGKLSYLAPDGLNPNQAVVVAPRLTELVRVTGDPTSARTADRLTFRGITWTETDYAMPADGLISPQAAVPVPGAFRVTFAADGLIESCRFLNLGGYALELGRGAQHWRIAGNEIRGSGAGGLRLGEPGDREPDALSACHRHTVIDNHLHQLGRIFAPAVGLIVFQSGGNRIAHNRIHDLYYTAISVGWNWGYRETPCRDNLIEFNHLHDVGQGRLSDMGGVYTLGPQPGTIVRNNLIHDVISYDYGGWGLYTDEGSTGIVMENNVVYRCKSAGFHQHYGRDNLIRNNIFAFNRENQLMRTRDEDHTSFRLTHNIVYFDSGQLLGSSWRNNRFILDHNLYFDRRAGSDPAALRFAGGTWSEWRARGHDANSRIADPLFVDPDRDDFRLRPESPALAVGFRPIDTSRVGPRPGPRPGSDL
ncbi:MAG: right-handed parallel beta-helix repeat-containing protein [Verrucomicrobiae bacterium]|nr:right-handed parallel beta-helix repeat-containing protein [Verrucomicrobiae bacterium]